MKILVMGLPGSGKTVFSSKLADVLDCPRLNNDEVRKAADDWDFSDGGRLRQCVRMKEMAEAVDSKIVICDFICPTEEFRQLFEPDLLIWMDTIKQSIYRDTNKVFEPPGWFGYKICTRSNNLYDLAIKHVKKTIFNEHPKNEHPRREHPKKQYTRRTK